MLTPQDMKRQNAAGTLFVVVLVTLALWLAIKEKKADPQFQPQPVAETTPRTELPAPPVPATPVLGVSVEVVRATEERVKALCPTLRQGYGELLEKSVSRVTREGHHGYELNIVAPRRFSALPEGRLQVYATDQHCTFEVDEKAKRLETYKRACELLCTGQWLEYDENTRFLHPF